VPVRVPEVRHCLRHGQRTQLRLRDRCQVKNPLNRFWKFTGMDLNFCYEAVGHERYFEFELD
jgi:hypothetical protein